jgi:hypothetical protein
MLATLHAPRMVALPNDQLAIVGLCGPFERKAPLYYECGGRDSPPVGVGFRIENGEVFAGVDPVNAYQRQPWWRTAPFALLPIPLFVLLGVTAWPAGRYARTPQRRRVLGLAALGAALFVAALLLELQFAYDLAHSTLHWLPVLWRVLFPVAAALLLASAALTVPTLRPVPGSGRPVRAAFGATYRVVLAIGSLALVWLIWVWGLAWPFH